MRLRDAEQLHSTVALYTQGTVHKGETFQLYSTEKYGTQISGTEKDRNFDARRDDRTAHGAAVKRELEMANVAVTKEQEDSSHWLPNGQRSKGHTCSFRHDEHEKGKGKDVYPTRYSSRDSNRSSGGDGKGTKDKGPTLSAQPENDTSLLEVHTEMVYEFLL